MPIGLDPTGGPLITSPSGASIHADDLSPYLLRSIYISKVILQSILSLSDTVIYHVLRCMLSKYPTIEIPTPDGVEIVAGWLRFLDAGWWLEVEGWDNHLDVGGWCRVGDVLLKGGKADEGDQGVGKSGVEGEIGDWWYYEPSGFVEKCLWREGIARSAEECQFWKGVVQFCAEDWIGNRKLSNGPIVL